MKIFPFQVRMNTFRHFQLFFFAILFSLLAASAYSAETPSATNYKVGYWYLPGYHEQNANGERRGYGYEYMEKIAACMGWNFTYVGYDESWAQLLLKLENGEIDILSNATKTPDRLKRFDYSDRPIGQSFTILTVKAGDNRYRLNDYANWNGMRVGMIKESSRNRQFERFALEKSFRYIPVIYPTYDALKNALKNGTVDALLTTNTRRTDNEWIIGKTNPDPLYIIVRKGNKPLLNAVNQALSLLEINAPRLAETLTERYYASAHAKSIPMTAEEQRFVDEARKNGKVFKALLMPDRWPMSTYRDGEIKGIFRDIADLIAERSGLNIKIIPCKNRQEYQDILLRGDYDLILDTWANYPYAEKHNLYLSEPYFSSPMSLLFRKDREKPNGRKAIIRNSWLLNELRFRGNDDSDFLLCDSTAELEEAVKNGVVDMAYLHTRMANDAIHRDHSMTLASQLVYGLQTEYAVGCKRTLPPELSRIMGKAVRSVSADDILQISSRYELKYRETFSVHDWIAANPFQAVMIASAVLFAVIVLLIFLLLSRRRLFRNGKILAKLPVRFFVADRHYHILMFNAPDLLAPQSEWAMVDEYETPEVVSAMKQAVDEAFENGSASIDYVHEGKRRTGSTEKLPSSLFGRETVIWVSQNTEELQASRSEAQKLAEHLHLMLSSIGDAVIATNLDRSISLMNPVAESLTGWTAQEAAGKKIEDIFCIVNGSGNNKIESPILTCLRENRIVELENHTDLIARDGSRRHIADSSAPIHDASGAVIGAILVFRDVTKEYRHREELNQALALARSAEKAKSIFLATMSHEIRTPLNAVIGFTELLKDSALSSEQRDDYLNDISSAGNALLMLINDVLDLSKLESGQMKFVSVETNFPNLLNEVVSIFKAQCRNNKIAIETQISAMPHVFIDHLRIRQILFNLVGNAVKFTDHGSITLHAEFSCDTETAGTLKIAVADTGIGIDQESQQSLFEPFVQSRTLRGTQTANQGTGLGLAIVRRMLAQMNGDIALESEPGKGSTFTVTLREIPYKEVASPNGNPNSILTDQTFSALTELSVLLVDDVALNLKVESAMLQKLGVKTVTAVNAEEALSKLEQNKFDMLLTDLWMPGLNGMELARRIKRDRTHHAMRIIAVTADAESQATFDMTVFDGIVTKPVTMENLYHLLHSFERTAKGDQEETL